MAISGSKRLAALAFASVIAFGACSNNSGATASPGGAASNPASAPASVTPSAEALTGEVSISGSSTVQPISQAVAEAFNATQPDVAITVDGPGTGDGFKLFCKGETDISDASRKIKDEEAKTCADAGI